MNNNQIEIFLVDHWKTSEIIQLYKTADWWKEGSDETVVPLLIKNSFSFAVAFDKKINKAIGMGRVLSDGVSDAYIQDVVVHPNYRGKGIGRRLVQKLIDFCLLKKVEWIALISEPHQEGFYYPLGFKEMKQYIPMKYDLVK